MEGLAPPLKFIIFLRYGIEKGESIRSSLLYYIDQNQDEFSIQIALWFKRRENGNILKEEIQNIKSPYRRALILLLERGLNGESILPQLCSIEKELYEICQIEIDEFISLLPLKMLLPLLLLQFPAFLILLFGPLLIQMLKSF